MSIVGQPTVAYLHPFGTTQIENIELLKLGGNGPLLFCYDQEPLIPEYNRPLFDFIRQFKNDQGEPKPTILLNTERNSAAKNILLEKNNFIDCYYFFHAFAAADWYRGYQYCHALIEPSQRKINKKFITFNRITGRARVYRSLFVGELVKNDLLKHGHVSFSDVCPEHGHYSKSIYDASNHNVPLDYINEIKDLLDSVTYPLRVDFTNKDLIPNGSQVLSAIPECMESFLYVVTETCFWDTKEHLTEKIFKPIVSKQPFVLLGCANNLAYLRSYGFKTFGDWWDESYDGITDPIKRIQAVVKIISDISKKSDQELESMLKDMQQVLDHNYNWFYSKEFLDVVWNELTINLTSAIARSLLQTAAKI